MMKSIFGGGGDKQSNQNPYFNSSQVMGDMKGGGRSKVNYKNKKKNNSGKNFQAMNSATKGMAGAASAIGDSMGTEYDTELGMEKPSMGKDMMDFSVSGQLGVWGLLADIPKNIVGHYQNKRAYHGAKGKQQLMNSINEQQRGLGADYTNMARYGYSNQKKMAKYGYSNQKNMMYGGDVQNTQNAATPVTMERNEIVLSQGQDGSYKSLMETGNEAPTHEQGGVDAVLPNNSVVFPDKYVNRIKQALAVGDNDTINKLKNQMMMESTAASLQGLPFSNSNNMRYGGGGNDEKKKFMMKQMISQNSSLPFVRRMMQRNPDSLYVGKDEEGYDMHGTHQLGSYGNYVLPRIVREGSSLKQLGSPDEVREYHKKNNFKNAMKFNNPDDAIYFAKNYKDVALMGKSKK